MKKSLIIYYLLLLVILSTWNSPELPPMMYRLTFLVFTVAPVMFSNNKLFPCVLSTFVMISANRHVPSYMPFMPIYLTITTLLALIGKNYKTGVKAPPFLIVLILLTFFVDMVRSMSVENISITALMTLLFFSFINSNVENRIKEISTSFVVISTFLCIEIFVFRSEFTYSLSVGNLDYDRVGWNDPNYFSAIIGMGAIAALNLLLSRETIRKRNRIILMGVIMFVIMALLMVASRGGVAAVFGGAATLFILYRKQSRTSTEIMLLIVAFLVVLYDFGEFDFLMSRFSNDEGEFGGRRIIWMSKLADFSANATPLEWMTGMGYKRALSMSTYLNNKEIMGFHNDYVAFLVSYGIIGVLIVVALYVYPILRYKDPRVTAICVYIIIISMSLEPLFSGALDVFYFYFYACVLGESTRARAKLGHQIKSMNIKRYRHV